ncbi:sce7726 family protein [Paraburkholderia sp. BR14263]|uniref:sce7726 family protein n=1 Tax=unclassified Paraburkholderia TaxID=2615204 RepID=UPI0034CE1A23
MPNHPATSQDNGPVTEIEIRGALLSWLARKRSKRHHVLEEFRIERGGARIDVAVFGEAMIGYEIKSDLDTFARFSNQIHAYNRVFDQIHLVCGPAHATSALEIIPAWWGLLVASRSRKGKITLELSRKAGCNARQDPFSLASLLWKEEAIAAIQRNNCIQLPKAASSHALWESIASTYTLDAVKTLVSTALLQRQISKACAVKII